MHTNGHGPRKNEQGKRDGVCTGEQAHGRSVCTGTVTSTRRRHSTAARTAQQPCNPRHRNSSSDEHKMATVDPATQGVAPPRDARATHQWEARGGARMVAGRLALLGAARRPRLIRSVAKRHYHAQYHSNHVQCHPAMQISPLNRPTGEGRHSKTSPWSP